jgi:hypothetical protein
MRRLQKIQDECVEKKPLNNNQDPVDMDEFTILKRKIAQDLSSLRVV